MKFKSSCLLSTFYLSLHRTWKGCWCPGESASSAPLVLFIPRPLALLHLSALPAVTFYSSNRNVSVLQFFSKQKTQIHDFSISCMENHRDGMRNNIDRIHICMVKRQTVTTADKQIQRKFHNNHLEKSQTSLRDACAAFLATASRLHQATITTAFYPKYSSYSASTVQHIISLHLCLRLWQF